MILLFYQTIPTYILQNVQNLSRFSDTYLMHNTCGADMLVVKIVQNYIMFGDVKPFIGLTEGF